MWHLHNVPKICHIYWGGGELLYLRYLTVKTFIEYNPDWQVIFWYPVQSFKGKSWGIEHNYLPLNPKLCKDYMPNLLKLPITKMPVNFSELGFLSESPEVHKADYMRINALYLYGGTWTDLDILYFKSMESLNVNIPENNNKEAFVCISPHYGHSTGFNMAAEGSEFFNVLRDKLNKEYNPGFYQCWGPDIFNKYFKKLNSIPGGVNLDMDIVYAHDCHSVKELIESNTPRFTENSIGCHWYAGHSMWGKFFNETHGGEDNLPDNVIGNLIKDAQSGRTR